MGAALRGRRKLAQLKDQWPSCCFCGGKQKNETWDHIPGRLLFPDKRRPRGLEFPACDRCNQLTKGEEAVLAFLARLSGSIRPLGGFDEATRKALSIVRLQRRSLLEQIIRSGRGVLTESNGIVRRAVAVEVRHSDWDQPLSLVGAKFAIALYFEHCQKILSEAGIVTVFSSSIARPHSRNFFNAALSLPNSGGLRMGKWSVNEYFYYRYVIDAEARCAIFCLIFYESIGLMCKVFEDEQELDVHWTRSYRPSSLHGIEVVLARNSTEPA